MCARWASSTVAAIVPACLGPSPEGDTQHAALCQEHAAIEEVTMEEDSEALSGSAEAPDDSTAAPTTRSALMAAAHHWRPDTPR